MKYNHEKTLHNAQLLHIAHCAYFLPGEHNANFLSVQECTILTELNCAISQKSQALKAGFHQYWSSLCLTTGLEIPQSVILFFFVLSLLCLLKSQHLKAYTLFWHIRI